MKRVALGLCAALALAVLFVHAGCSKDVVTATSHPPRPPGCTCETASRANEWCDACGIGYFASVPIASRLLFDVIDAHGHSIDPASVGCRSCKAALDVDGFCGRCGLGFVRGRAYLSECAHALALGEIEDPGELTCDTCRANSAGSGGWCERCKRGLIGTIALRDREATAEAVRTLHRLRDATTHIERCEVCAVAVFTGGRCPRCGISYEDP